MNSFNLQRKRIWEVDCLSMDAAIAAWFDWRELVNFLESAGNRVNHNQSNEVLEMQAQCMIHQSCHSENELSLKIENLLNLWSVREMEMFDSFTPKEAINYLLTIPLNQNAKLGSLYWALGTDPREGFDCIRRRFHQRLQVVSTRALIGGQEKIILKAG